MHPRRHPERRRDPSHRQEEVRGGEAPGGQGGEGSLGTGLGPGLRVGYLPWNLTIIPVGQAEWREQRAQELAAVVTQNMPARHSQTREEFREHGFFSTRLSKGHREGSQRTGGGRGRGSRGPPPSPRDSPARERGGCCGFQLGRADGTLSLFFQSVLEMRARVQAGSKGHQVNISK